jgi:chromate reductase, NAD(P)H dehydrogenase (quinone)
MTTIVGVAGSLRKNSYNAMLLRAAVKLAPPGTTIEIGSIRAIPLYDGDDEVATGIPPAAVVLKDLIARADGLLLVTPEYNHSIPGVFKNAIDWLSRPRTDIARVFGGKPVALIGATPGKGGTMLAQSAWLPVLETLGTAPYFGAKLHVSNAEDVFDEAGQLTDEKTRSQLQALLAGFAVFASS